VQSLINDRGIESVTQYGRQSGKNLRVYYQINHGFNSPIKILQVRHNKLKKIQC